MRGLTWKLCHLGEIGAYRGWASHFLFSGGPRSLMPYKDHRFLYGYLLIIVINSCKCYYCRYLLNTMLSAEESAIYWKYIVFNEPIMLIFYAIRDCRCFSPPIITGKQSTCIIIDNQNNNNGNIKQPILHFWPPLSISLILIFGSNIMQKICTIKSL